MDVHPTCRVAWCAHVARVGAQPDDMRKARRDFHDSMMHLRAKWMSQWTALEATSQTGASELLRQRICAELVIPQDGAATCPIWITPRSPSMAAAFRERLPRGPAPAAAGNLPDPAAWHTTAQVEGAATEPRRGCPVFWSSFCRSAAQAKSLLHAPCQGAALALWRDADMVHVAFGVMLEDLRTMHVFRQSEYKRCQASNRGALKALAKEMSTQLHTPELLSNHATWVPAQLYCQLLCAPPSTAAFPKDSSMPALTEEPASFMLLDVGSGLLDTDWAINDVNKRLLLWHVKTVLLPELDRCSAPHWMRLTLDVIPQVGDSVCHPLAAFISVT